MVAMMQIRRRPETALTLAHSQPPAAAEPAEADATIRVSNLSIVFDTPQGQVIAVDRVTFSVRQGEFVCIVGPSGCGKSTVLNTIAGLEVPYSGEVTVNGTPMQRPRPDVGMVFQQPHLFPWKSVRRNIAHGPRMLGKSRGEAGAIADGLIEMIGLGRFADAYPHTLSGGMQQRVAIARALANQPRVLLMDEPFGALDAQTRSVMQDNLLELRERIDATVVFVTHDIDEAILLADRVLIMSAGPGRILRDLGVNLPRPRSNAIMLDPAYIALKKDCLDLIRSEGRRAFDQSSAG
ncbi:MAG: ABC transporter ATP-binding protein [Pseudomonadota bacterium]